MKVLGNYTINVDYKKAYLSDQIAPLFNHDKIFEVGFKAYFLNVIPSERRSVKRQILKAISNLTEFDVEHKIKLKGRYIKIKNTGKVSFQKTSESKKITGTIVNLDQLSLADFGNPGNTSFTLSFSNNDFMIDSINHIDLKQSFFDSFSTFGSKLNLVRANFQHIDSYFYDGRIAV